MGKLLTDASVAAAVRAVANGRKATTTLADAAPRGAGRLLLVAKPGRAEWYAQRFVDGRRQLQKLGAYPAVGLAEARERHAGHKPATGRATLGQLLDAYLATLEGRPSHKQARCVMRAAGATIGRSRLARDVGPADIVACIRPAFSAGKRAMAAKHRMYLSAAFKWALQSAHDYRASDPRDWGLTHNPADAVPVDDEATRAGERWLSVPELVAVLRWAMAGRPGTARQAVAVMLLTGQRVSEVLRARAEHWDSAERTLHWPTTKNGRPHTAPVCEQAARLLDAITPTEAGYLFRGNRGREHLCIDSVRATLKRAGYAGQFTARDFRRTWKTLAGQAGVTKVERDLIQHHGRGDISSRHYDRWEAMPEKRTGIATWEGWLAEQLGENRAHGQAQQVVQAEQHGHAEQIAAII